MLSQELRKTLKICPFQPRTLKKQQKSIITTKMKLNIFQFLNQLSCKFIAAVKFFIFYTKKFRFESPYQATCTGSIKPKQRSDSPHSTRSAPWSQPHSRGLYNNSVPPSPRSVRSAGPRYRSSSIDSQSSNESRSCKR